MVDYVENLERLVAVGWPSASGTVSLFGPLAPGDYWTFTLPTGAAPGQFLKLITGVTSGTTLDYTLLPTGPTGYATVFYFAGDHPYLMNPLYKEDGTVLALGDRPAIGLLPGNNPIAFIPCASYTKDDWTVTPSIGAGTVRAGYVRCTRGVAWSFTDTESQDAAIAKNATVADVTAACVSGFNALTRTAATGSGSSCDVGADDWATFPITISATYFPTGSLVTGETAASVTIAVTYDGTVSTAAPTAGFNNPETVRFSTAPP